MKTIIFILLLLVISITSIKAQQKQIITEITGTGRTALEIFNFNLNNRQRLLNEEEKRFWWKKLNQKLNGAGIKYYEFGMGPHVLEIKQTLLPILRLYERENYTEILYYDSPIPSVDLYAEHILIVTSAAKKLFDNELLRAAAAHELAHEVFSVELIKAIKTKNSKVQQAIEIKCDLLAVVALIILKEDPKNVSQAIYAIERAEIQATQKYNLKLNIGSHSSAANRAALVTEFLKYLKCDEHSKG